MVLLFKDLLIVAKGVSKHYTLGKIEVTALEEVSVQVKIGEFLALAGASGSGKTTLLNIIGAIDAPSSGQIIVDGVDLMKLSADQLAAFRRRKIGFIFQTFNLIPTLTAYENVEYPLMLLGLDAKIRKERVNEWLSKVGLYTKRNNKPAELSGGQRQRVAIARAMVKNPRLVLADEPTANLDKKTAVEILDLMQQINSNEQITFVFSTHDSLILERAKRVFRLDQSENSTVYEFEEPEALLLEMSEEED